MKQIKKTKVLAIFLCIMLIAASAMSLYSCEKTEGEVLGKGKTSFKLEVTDDNGETKIYTIKTDEKTLGNALIHGDVKLIEFDDYNMVATVNGITADWSVDEGWWKILINGEDASVGALEIEIDKSSVYSFVYTKGMEDAAG